MVRLLEAQRLDQILFRSPWTADPSEVEHLFSATSNGALHRCLFGEVDESHSVLDSRLGAWPRLLERRLASRALPTFDTIRPFEVWAYPLALAQLIVQEKLQCIGIAGPPGVGKTTLVSLVASCLETIAVGSKVLRVSLDDFYYSKNERAARGIPFRAQPGSHDLAAATKLLRAVQAKALSLNVPRFNHAIDDNGPAEKIRGPISIVLVEGWFLGMCTHGYHVLNPYIDFLIYLDCPIELARRRRFAREGSIWAATGGRKGMAPTKMERFWDEILGPGINLWVEPVRETSDLVIILDSRGEIIAATRRRRQHNLEFQTHSRVPGE